MSEIRIGKVVFVGALVVGRAGRAFDIPDLVLTAGWGAIALGCSRLKSKWYGKH